MKNTYVKTNWRDHIVDIESGDVIQDGTRFTASRMNNIEEGIDGAYEQLVNYKDELTKLRVQLEMVGRVPINNGTFFDTLDGQTAKQLTRLVASAVSQNSLTAGATSITLDKVPFTLGEYVTVYDDEKSETVKINAVSTNSITIPALTKMFKKGAVLGKTSAKFDSIGQEIQFGNWGNYSVAANEVV